MAVATATTLSACTPLRSPRLTDTILASPTLPPDSALARTQIS
ncbi:hypothetical protein ACWGMO_22930 [Nocardia salmonicida]